MGVCVHMCGVGDELVLCGRRLVYMCPCMHTHIQQ